MHDVVGQLGSVGLSSQVQPDHVQSPIMQDLAHEQLSREQQGLIYGAQEAGQCPLPQLKGQGDRLRQEQEQEARL